MMVERQRLGVTTAASLNVLLWLLLVVAVVVPVAIAANSPLLAWRDPIYVAAGLAGVIAMVLLLIQPLLAGGYLVGARGARGRRIHRWVGVGLLSSVFIHVVGLWLTSPPDVVDALLLRSPTLFSVWGVVAMWATIAAAFLAVFRRRLPIRRALWRFMHSVLAIIVVVGSVVHALQIEGTMGTWSKVMLCALVVIATGWVVLELRSWVVLRLE
ncbi:MAG: ferric reductase-like transmembrane domain-containing protein [Granulosicoccus sp.]